MNEHAVIVHFTPTFEDFRQFDSFEIELEKVMHEDDIYNSYEFTTDMSNGTLYLYGPNADRLYNDIRDVILNSTLFTDFHFVLRYGPEDSNSRVLHIIQ